LASLRRRGVGTVVVLLDRASFVGREDEEAQVELGAVRHALAEYDIGYHLLTAGDDIPHVLGGKGAGRRASRPKIMGREELRA
jgi:hypothetical protein